MKRSLLAISVLAVVCGPIPAATAKFQFNILSVTDSNPGQMPKVVFSVTDPANGAAYDIKTHPAFTSSAVSRMTVQIGWDTADIHNTGSGSEFAATPAAGQPISVNALSTSFSNGDGTFTVVFTKPIPGSATGTGMAFLEGRMAAQDVTGAYSIQAPVKGAYKYFVITGTGIVPRRQMSDRNRCNTCHTVLTVHGNQRTDELNGCVLCHNPNATDIPYRQYGDGPDADQFRIPGALDSPRNDPVHSLQGDRLRPLDQRLQRRKAAESTGPQLRGVPPSRHLPAATLPESSGNDCKHPERADGNTEDRGQRSRQQSANHADSIGLLRVPRRSDGTQPHAAIRRRVRCPPAEHLIGGRHRTMRQLPRRRQA